MEFKFSGQVGFSLLTIGLLSGSGCLNVFEPLDSPSNDEQYISAARACFDEDDFECALDYYKKISDNKKDVRNSENAFLTLDREGINMGAFIEAFDGGGGGKSVTKLANRQVGGAGQAKRVTLFNTVKASFGIEQQVLRGLVRLAGAVAIISELFAEDAGSDSKLDQTDLVDNVDACKNSTDTTCLTETGCLKTGSKLIQGTEVSFEAVGASVAGNPTLGILHGALKQLIKGLEEVEAGGKFKSGITTFATEIYKLTVPFNNATEQCYRRMIITQHVGE